MGIEQPQLAKVGEIFEKGTLAGPPTTGMMDPGKKTPNQHFLAIALALSCARLWPKLMAMATAEKMAEDFFALQAEHGHQAVGTGFDGDEQACYDPHAELWGGAAAAGLREARLMRNPKLLALYMGWWADHLAMIRPFWTAQGFRSPGSRCLTPAGMALRPSSVWDSRCYALITVLQSDEAGKARYGNIAPPAQLPFACLKDSASLFPHIVEESKAAHLKLMVPVRKWAAPGGAYVAALAADSTAIDAPVGFLEVDGGGGIVNAARLLAAADLPPGAPEIIGGPGGASSSVSPAAPAAPAPLPPSPPVTVDGKLPPTHAKQSLLDRIEAWLEAHL